MDEPLLESSDCGNCYGALFLCCQCRSRGRWNGCCGLVSFGCLFTVAFWIGVTRNLHCSPEILAQVDPPYGGQLLPANFTLVERKYLLIQFTKLVDVYDANQTHVGYFYDINLFVIMRFGFSDAHGRIWFEARYASFLSRFKPIIEYNVQRCDAGAAGRPSSFYELKELWWAESYWHCLVNCSRQFNLAHHTATAEVREHLLPSWNFGTHPEFKVSFDGWLVPTVRGQITGTVSSLGTGVRPDWSMHITDAKGSTVGHAHQHFVVGPPDQDMRVLSRWKVVTVLEGRLPHWMVGFLAVLDDAWQKGTPRERRLELFFALHDNAKEPPTAPRVELRSRAPDRMSTPGSLARGAELADVSRLDVPLRVTHVGWWNPLREGREVVFGCPGVAWRMDRRSTVRPEVNTGSGNRKVSQAIKNQLSAILNHRFTISGRGEEDYLAGHVCELAGRIDLREEIRKTMMQPQISQLRFLVCGGDGTVTWVLHEIEELKEEHPHLFANFQEEPAIGVVPAGTGNDLARSLGWGAKLRSVRELVGYVQWTLAADIVPLDQWKVTMTFKNLLGVTVRAPPAFHEKPPPVLNSDRTFEGFFQNYFSIGMDANVALGVSQARASCIGRCCFFFGCGKCCYGAQAYRTGVFNCCSHGLSLEGHAIQYRSLAAPAATTGMETLEVGRIRQLTLANINSYASGRVLLSTEELGKSSPNDHLLELVTFPNSCAFGWVMAGGRAKVLQRAAAVRFSLERAETIQIAWGPGSSRGDPGRSG
ncbi:unnamed protein product [Durusdinium trenchii]|uniref:diacylglycerol kinase (ATP) n=1 Tax=Durusdinium trenchii TaxID=1381693 RepID=A0ABP0SVC2_9DINO